MVADLQSCGHFYAVLALLVPQGGKRFGRSPTSGRRAFLGRYDLCLRDKECEILSDPAYVTVKQSKGN